MAVFETRMRVERTLEFTLKAPVAWTEVAKAMAVISNTLERMNLKQADDAAWFHTGDDELIIKVPIQVDFEVWPKPQEPPR